MDISFPNISFILNIYINYSTLLNCPLLLPSSTPFQFP